LKNRCSAIRPYLSYHSLLGAFLLFLLYPATLLAGEFSVSPIRMDFDRDTRTGIVTISAEGPEKLNLQMRAYEWTQDDQGKDVYTETQDLIFFPKIMTLSKGEKKTLRAGVESLPVNKEKAYRLYVEEIPSRKKSEGLNVSITLRFGIPVFVKPERETPGAEIEKVEVSDGVAKVTVKNTGNVHLVIDSITLKGKNAGGKETFSQELAGWYLLAGASKTYTATIPREACDGITRLYIEAATGKIGLKKEFELRNGMCPGKTQ
jgi:fimbrial chaperone protein